MITTIVNNTGEKWVLNSFGAYGPEASAVYFFTKEEAKRVIKSKRKTRLVYTIICQKNGVVWVADARKAFVVIRARSIQFGCQWFEGLEDTATLRTWALDK